jgi:iron complex outermembrane receptor protein
LPVSGADRHERPFEPETARQVELGVKYAPGAQMSVTAAAFELRRQNVLTTDPDDPNFSIQQGGALARHRAGSGGAAGQPAQTAGVPHLQSPEGDEGESGHVGHECAGQVAVRSAQADGFRVGRLCVCRPLARLSAGAGVRHVGASWGDAENTFQVPAFTLADLSLRYDLGQARSAWRGLSVGMTVKNLFDKYHVASCFSARACNYGEQRNVGVRVAYLW